MTKVMDNLGWKRPEIDRKMEKQLEDGKLPDAVVETLDEASTPEPSRIKI